MKNALLFVYGTWSNEQGAAGTCLKDNSGYYAAAKVKGHLYDIGEYPGAVLSPHGNDFIYGKLMKINSPEKTFGVLDNYHGYHPQQSWSSEFIRVLTLAETPQGSIDCWIYVYNLPLTGLKYLQAGRF